MYVCMCGFVGGALETYAASRGGLQLHEGGRSLSGTPLVQQHFVFVMVTVRKTHACEGGAESEPVASRGRTVSPDRQVYFASLLASLQGTERCGAMSHQVRPESCTRRKVFLLGCCVCVGGVAVMRWVFHFVLDSIRGARGWWFSCFAVGWYGVILWRTVTQLYLHGHLQYACL